MLLYNFLIISLFGEIWCWIIVTSLIIPIVLMIMQYCIPLIISKLTKKSMGEIYCKMFKYKIK